VALGCGIAGWFIIPIREGWIALVLALVAAAICAAMIGQGRLRRALVLFPLLAALGCVLAWWRSDGVEAPRLERPAVAQFTARIETVEMLAARGAIRLTLAPDPGQSLPNRVRVNVDNAKASPGLEAGTQISLRARLMPPMPSGSAWRL
jgi:competence protein ComEC